MNNEDLKVTELQIDAFQDGIDEVPIQPGELDIDPSNPDNIHGIKTPGQILIDYNYKKAWEDAVNNIRIHDITYDEDVTSGDIVDIPDTPQVYLKFEDIDFSKHYYNVCTQNVYKYIEERDKHDPWTPQDMAFVAREELPLMVEWDSYAFDDTRYYYKTGIYQSPLHKYDKKKLTDTIVGTVIELDCDPHDYEYELLSIDKDSYYVDTTLNTLFNGYKFDYKVYWNQVDYTGTIYMKHFDFYHRMMHKYVDINSTVRIDLNEVYCVWGKPEKYITEPETGRIYYDTKKLEYYLYDGNIFIKLIQDNKFIPFGIFY